MNTRNRNTADLVLIVAAVIVVLGALALFVGSAGAKTVETGYPVALPGGDCLADRADGDIIHKSDWYCNPIPGQAAKRPTEALPVSNEGIVEPTVEALPVVDGEETVSTNTPADKPAGNPGNTKPVGHAGENPNNKGTMPLDNAGGGGNGEHGNQGQGGNAGGNGGKKD